jgi:hypothetical protein
MGRHPRRALSVGARGATQRAVGLWWFGMWNVTGMPSVLPMWERICRLPKCRKKGWREKELGENTGASGDVRGCWGLAENNAMPEAAGIRKSRVVRASVLGSGNVTSLCRWPVLVELRGKVEAGFLQ